MLLFHIVFIIVTFPAACTESYKNLLSSIIRVFSWDTIMQEAVQIKPYIDTYLQ